MVRSRLSSILALAAGILITTGGCAESPSGAAVVDTSALVMLRAPQGPSFSRSGEGTSSAVIGPEGGTLSTSWGHQLVFPAGALSEPTEITMSTDPIYVGVHLQPHGLEFPANAAPVLTLNATGATVGFTRLAVVYVDDAGQIAEVLPTRTVNGAVVRTQLRHFSGYITTGHRQ